jgi:leucyl/phenylalanyl-tRNA---protein transferase
VDDAALCHKTVVTAAIMTVFVLSENIAFPPAHLADETGLLAIGGDLSQERLLAAYRNGIFPWYSADEPILWWSPDPRLVMYPNELKVHKRLIRRMKTGGFKITLDESFHEVMLGCAAPRRAKQDGTWIVPEMMHAYNTLHAAGYAHSVEAWREGQLVGGLYGVSLGGCFFGESMFTRVPDASKVAFVSLVQYLSTHHFDMIDCQVTTAHLLSFGAREISRRRFLKQLRAALKTPSRVGVWRF